MSEKLNPVFAIILQAAKEQASCSGKIVVHTQKQITGNYTVEGKEVKKQ